MIVRWIIKKCFVLLLFSIFLCSNSIVYAHCHNHVYLVHKDFYQEEQNFHNCDKHYVLTETTVCYYSNGSRRTYTNSTIFNKDGSIVATNCRDVKHLIFNKKHYFTFYKNKKYNILDESGVITSVKNYKKMEEIAPNKLLVKLDKKYGIIDLKENKIVPIKYKKFEKIGDDLYLTKLNGFWGILNSSNKTILRNQYDKITPIYECFKIKRKDKYGLIDSKGNIIINAKCDSIKKIGEYIIVKLEGKFGVYDSVGNKISECIYRKIRLERNILEGKLGKIWEEIISL